MNTEIRKHAIGLIWRGFNSLEIAADIVKRFDLIPGGHDEQQVSDLVSQLRTDIQQLVADLPSIIEQALRKGFSRQQVVEVINRDGDNLIPSWNLDVLISGVQARIDKEKEPEREAVEKAASEARRAAAEKQVAGALAALRAMGVQL